MKNLNPLEINAISGGKLFSTLIIWSIEAVSGKKLDKIKRDRVKNLTTLAFMAAAAVSFFHAARIPAANQNLALATGLMIWGCAEGADKLPWPLE